MLTVVSSTPAPGLINEIVGGGGRTTVNPTPLLLARPRETTTAPLSTSGIVAVMALSLHEMTFIEAPFRDTLPCEPPKLIPVMVIGSPGLPDTAVSASMCGGF